MGRNFVGQWLSLASLLAAAVGTGGCSGDASDSNGDDGDAQDIRATGDMEQALDENSTADGVVGHVGFVPVAGSSPRTVRACAALLGVDAAKSFAIFVTFPGGGYRGFHVLGWLAHPRSVGEGIIPWSSAVRVGGYNGNYQDPTLETEENHFWCTRPLEVDKLAKSGSFHINVWTEGVRRHLVREDSVPLSQ